MKKSTAMVIFIPFVAAALAFASDEQIGRLEEKAVFGGILGILFVIWKLVSRRIKKRNSLRMQEDESARRKRNGY